jgi:hypothetical protein
MKVLSDIENLAGCTPAKWGKALSGPPIVNSAENRVNFCKAVDGKPLSSTVYGMYMVTLNELKATMKTILQAGQRFIVNKTSVE